jgi:hypothetical protein
MKIYKCDKLCTVSDREVKCKKCGKKTKYLCDVDSVEERDLLIGNLQKNKFEDFKHIKDKK